MFKDSQILDDLAKVAGGVMGNIVEIKREIEAMATAQVDKVLNKMNLVTREEFEVVKAMEAASRAEQEALKIKIKALEARLNSGK